MQGLSLDDRLPVKTAEVAIYLLRQCRRADMARVRSLLYEAEVIARQHGLTTTDRLHAIVSEVLAEAGRYLDDEYQTEWDVRGAMRGYEVPPETSNVV